MKRHLALILLLLLPVPSTGQTVLNEAPAKPGEERAQADEGAQPEHTGAETPTGGTITYPDLHQPGRISADTATIQRAWDSAPEPAGVAEYRFCPACVYRVRTRELMVTTIVLPAGREIEQIDLGDPVGFEAQPRSGNMVAIRPRSFGIDTNMNVYTDRGVMTFYLRAEGFDSAHVPDLVVKIGPDMALANAVEDPPSGIVPEAASLAGAGTPPGRRKAVVSAWSGESGFDPAKLRGWGDYRLRGDAGLRPETVFRDDHFTYIHFGDKWPDIELPVAFVVIDGIDETVNTRVMGRTLVVESTAPVISLKSGESFLCVEYTGGTG